MKKLLTYIFLLCSLSAFSQANLFSAGECVTAAPPAFNPGARGCRTVLDTSTMHYWIWKIGTTWVKQEKAPDQIVGCSAPLYTPTKHQSDLAINACTPIPLLYRHVGGGVWNCMNCAVVSATDLTFTGSGPTYNLNSSTGNDVTITQGTGVTLTRTGNDLTITGNGTTYTAGTGINISGGNVISNTGDLSSTNELNTAFSVTGSNLRITDAGGTINVPVTDIAPVQSLVAGTGISITGTSAKTINSTITQGITTLNGLTPTTQTFATGTSGTDFAINSATSTHTFNLPTASATNRGALSSADWTTFNNKGVGTVTSVGLDLPAEFVEAGTPVTTTGTLSATWAAQAANLVFRSGNAGGTPSFTALTAADIPAGTNPDTLPTRYVRVFIITGQSNSRGYASISSVPAGTIASNPKVKIWNIGSQAFENLNISAQNNYGGIANSFGPEWGIAKYGNLAWPNDTLYIIKYGAISLPSDISVFLPGGVRYDTLWSNVKAAVNKLRAGTLYPLVTMCFLEGETDAGGTTANRDSFPIRLDRFVDTWKYNLDVDLGVITPKIRSVRTYTTEINKSIVDKMSSNTNCNTFDTWNFPTGDGTHYDYIGQDSVGLRIINNLLSNRTWGVIVDSLPLTKYASNSTGIANRLARWNANSDLSYSSIYENTLGVSFNFGGGATSNYIMQGGGVPISIPGRYNVGFGYNNFGALTTSTTDQNAAFGVESLASMTSGDYNSAFNYRALYSLTTGQYNTGIGPEAGYSIIGGTGNIAIGGLSLHAVTNTNNNMAIGTLSGNAVTGSENVMIGSQTMRSATSADFNIAIGTGAGGQFTTYTGDNSVMIGYLSGTAMTSGGSNVFIGFASGATLTTESNRLVIDNSNTTTPLIGGDFTNNYVGINTASASIARNIHVTASDAVTNAVTYSQRNTHITSGTAAVGFGDGKEVELENASGTNRVVATDEYAYSDPTNATEDVTVTRKIIKAGTLTTAQTTLSTGETTFAGDVTVPDEVYGAGWDASLEVPTKNAVYDKVQAVAPITGSFSGVGTATTVFTVTIGATMANTTYKVNATPTAILSAAVFYVTNKTTTTFDVTYLAGLTGTVTFDWALFP